MFEQLKIYYTYSPLSKERLNVDTRKIAEDSFKCVCVRVCDDRKMFVVLRLCWHTGTLFAPSKNDACSLIMLRLHSPVVTVCIVTINIHYVLLCSKGIKQ